jgi:hypothetical protein
LDDGRVVEKDVSQIKRGNRRIQGIGLALQSDSHHNPNFYPGHAG